MVRLTEAGYLQTQEEAMAVVGEAPVPPQTHLMRDGIHVREASTESGNKPNSGLPPPIQGEECQEAHTEDGPGNEVLQVRVT